MIILDATTKSLQMVLGAAVATNQLPFAVSYVNSTGTTTTPGEQDGTSNNTTAVTIASAPASSSQTLIKNIVIRNADTASATVTIIYNNNSTLRYIVVATLAAGDQLIYEDGNGWSSVNSSAQLKTSGGSGGAVSSVSNLDGSLAISPTTGSVVASLGNFGANTVLANATSSSAQPTGVSISASQLLGRGSSGNVAAITLGSNLSMSGTTLSASGGGVIPALSSFQNLKIVWASDSTATITAGQIILQTSGAGAAYLATSVNVTLNSATSGAGGLDTGSLAASTWYYVYLVYNGTTLNALMSASSSSPTLPSGYTYFTSAIGAVRSDGSKNFVGFIQYGRDWQYVVGNNLTDLPVIASGTASAWTAVATGSYVPSTASKIRISVYNANSGSNNVAVVPNSNYNTSISGSNLPFLGSVWGSSAPGVYFYLYTEMTLESADIYWYSNGSGNSIGAIGFTLNI